MKKLLSLVVAMLMVFGLVAVMPTAAPASTDKVAYTRAAGSFDGAIANREKIETMLRVKGVIPANANSAQAQQAVTNFLNAKAKNDIKTIGTLGKQAKTVQDSFMSKMNTNGITNGLGLKNGQSAPVAPAQEKPYTGSKFSYKILTILMEYPDLNHNTINPADTDMYYANFDKAHYEQVLFSPTGYVGPDGQVKMSMKQYYEAQSGGSYSVDGAVINWSMAKNNAAYYGGNVPDVNGSDNDPRTLVQEAIASAAANKTINLADFDQEDKYDLDGDGNFVEPDGIIDHVMVIFAGVGEEAGGGKLGPDAIWSHSWSLSDVTPVPGYRNLYVYDYTAEPEDGAAGVFSHEFGHDLGLPDEYDTIYSGQGEPVGYWSIMSAGSWAGTIPGTEPTNFSPYAKSFLQARYGGNWVNGTTVNFNDITASGAVVQLDQANTRGTTNGAVRINLPDQTSVVNTPYSGTYEYFSGKGDYVDNSMNINVNLTTATTAQLSFKTWYSIEQDWDYASVQVRPVGGTTWTSIPGNITTTSSPYGQNPGNGITGNSNGWVNATFDLSAYKGQNIELRYNYWTDGAVAMPGFYVDDIVITANGATILSDNADGNTLFTLNGFKKDLGKVTKKGYYLVEWRNHAGADMGLAHLKRGNSLMSYDPGLVVWYVDESYTDNWTGVHPGEGYLGVVDADQNPINWSDQYIAATDYQIHDAAFGLTPTQPMYLDYTKYGYYMRDNQTVNNPIFDDSRSYYSKFIPDAGKKLPTFGLKIRVLGESTDRTAAQILIYR